MNVDYNFNYAYNCDHDYNNRRQVADLLRVHLPAAARSQARPRPRRTMKSVTCPPARACLVPVRLCVRAPARALACTRACVLARAGVGAAARSQLPPNMCICLSLPTVRVFVRACLRMCLPV